MDKEILLVLRELVAILAAESALDHEDIDLTPGDYAPAKSFRLYVGVEGQVVGLTERGKACNRHFVAGYHPVWFKSITKAGTTATSLAACFPD